MANTLHWLWEKVSNPLVSIGVRADLPRGLYKAVNSAGEIRYFGNSCPICKDDAPSTPGQFTGDYRFWCCGKTYSFPFSELRSTVKKTVRIGGPANVFFVDSMDAGSGPTSGSATFRQPQTRKTSLIREILTETFHGWDNDAKRK